MAISVLLVDDNALFRDGIAQILEADGRFHIVGQASRGDEAIAAALALRPQLILIDLQMPGISGTEAIRRIRVENGEVAIGVLTMFETEEHIQSALDAGASGYVAKDSTPSDLRAAAVALAGGKRNLVAIPTPPPYRRGAASGASALQSLTRRELEVLRALATSETNAAIARRLQISPKTLRNHISNTYHKLGIFDRTQAVIVAVREGLIEM